MSRYFPHTPYAEDQPLAGTILTIHVLVRSVTTGTVLGIGKYGTQSLVRRIRKQPAPLVPKSHLLLAATGKYTIWTVGIVSLGLVARMWGREDIEWKDRTWRLLENKGQIECDDFTYAGMLAGLGAAAVKSVRKTGWVGAVGAVGLGSTAGMLGYMGWRYGVHGGKFAESEERS
ncbi:hypothetical protein BKA67DRAFT_534236 [Truncatella angustata]|uniref:Uncharacterized protein n=1 Tax=Truncatella angustata TaxID=152316 RepID=A0A9P8UN85_9PEZI|nr:uncharacterized protein BKA67DRAFT_534236 [Truncatella angustata]KAH6655307.1 hypothetical protein BKA67DRAFT_534236 [Truncatella angustata]KAH8205189.1 hypothetical protein TruAng_000601 [Truncatella angustata]